MGLRRLIAGAVNGLIETSGPLAVCGRLSVPGSATLTLPAGAVKIWYFEAKKSPSRGDELNFRRPADMQATVTPLHGGPALSVEGPGWHGKGSSRYTGPGESRDLYGTVHVDVAGDFQVVVSATVVADAVGPLVLLST